MAFEFNSNEYQMSNNLSKSMLSISLIEMSKFFKF